MRNVWKGLIIGAFTGAVAGLGLEAVEGGTKRVGQGACQVGDAVADRLPGAIDKTKDAAGKVTDVIADRAPDVADATRQAAGSARDWATQQHS